MTPSLRSRRLLGGVSLLVFLSFAVYFGLLCFRQIWAGDLQLYCAAVRRLYDSPWHPTHEAVVAPGTQSFAYSPYLVAVGLSGRALGVSPYRALQLAGAFNVAAFAAGGAYVFSRHSLHRSWPLPAACFLYVTIWVRWQHFGWSSETDLITLSFLQAYPSTIAWALALFAFGLMKGLAEERRLVSLGALGLVVAVLLLTHALTASWAVGIVGLYGLFTAGRERRWAPLIYTLLGLGLGLGLSLCWPYSPLLGQSSLAAAPERSIFGETPLRDALNLYCLGLPCAAYLVLRLGRHAFFVLGLFATLAALFAWRVLGFDYGNRYTFFAAFFAQFMLAEVMALGLFGLFGPTLRAGPGQRWPRFDRPATIAVTGLALLAWLPSPAWREQRWQIVSLRKLLALPSAHDRYYARYTELREHIGADDVVLMPTSHIAFDLAALTGAHFVTAPYSVRLLDDADRQEDVLMFFDPGIGADERVEIARERGATKALLLSGELRLRTQFIKVFGKPVYRDAYCILFNVKR